MEFWLLEPFIKINAALLFSFFRDLGIGIVRVKLTEKGMECFTTLFSNSRVLANLVSV